MIRARSGNPDLLYVSTMDIHGGQEICVSFSQEAIDLLNWAREQRKRSMAEEDLRDGNPALLSCWNDYQTMLRLVRDRS